MTHGPVISEHKISIKTGATPLIQIIFWLIYFYDQWLITKTNNWYAMTLAWSTQITKYQIKCMFWWKHDIKICSCWWIMTPTFWRAPVKLNDIDNHHSWSSLQVWLPTNKYRQVDLIFQWHIRPTDGIQHVVTCCKISLLLLANVHHEVIFSF